MDIYLIDGNLDPESTAMLQAFYSRSSRSITERLDGSTEEVKEKLKRFYVQYGHKSIGDCGSTEVFFEGVSILFAKVLQDHALYNGQETSSRYIDFSKAEAYTEGLPETLVSIQNSWFALYTKAVRIVREKLHERLPWDTGSTYTQEEWDKAIRARAFDICRSLIPAGAKTKLSVHMTLRSLYEKLESMFYHPLPEVSKGAEEALEILKEKYPHAFSHPPTPSGFSTVLNYPLSTEAVSQSCKYTGYTLISKEEINFLQSRPKHVQVPRYFDRYRSYHFSFMLDYGSFRDLQRHRSAIISLPVLTMQHGMHRWYLNQIEELDHALGRECASLIVSTRNQLKKSNDILINQYCIPLGMRVPVFVTCGLASAIYISELRSRSTVHPTLRPLAQYMGHCIQSDLNIAVHLDMSPDEFVPHRGKQDIVEKITGES